MPIHKSRRTERPALTISIIIHLLAYFALLIWMNKWVIESDESFGFMEVEFLEIKRLEVMPRKRPNMPITRLATFEQRETTAPSEGGSQVDRIASLGNISLLPITSNEQKIPGTVSPIIGFGDSPPNNTLPVSIWSHGQELWIISDRMGADIVSSQRRFQGAPTNRGRHHTLFRFVESRQEELSVANLDVNLGMTKFLGNTPRTQRVIYCLDVSASMYQPHRKIIAAATAVKGSMKALHSSSRFNIIAFASQVKAMNSNLMTVNKRKLNAASVFLDGFLGEPSDFCGTDILAALHEACLNSPTEIILMTDGWAADNPNAPRSIVTDPYLIATQLKAYNLSHARLYTIGLGVHPNSSAARLLKRLAVENDGIYKFPSIDEF